MTRTLNSLVDSLSYVEQEPSKATRTRNNKSISQHTSKKDPARVPKAGRVAQDSFPRSVGARDSNAINSLRHLGDMSSPAMRRRMDGQWRTRLRCEAKTRREMSAMVVLWSEE